MTPIVLQDTISDFLEMEAASGATPNGPRIFIPFGPAPSPDMASNFLYENKYVMSAWRTSDASASSPAVQRTMIVQQLCWMAGRMNVAFHEDSHPVGSWAGFKDDLVKTTNVLKPQCRYRPVFFTSLEQIRSVSKRLVVMPFCASDALARTLPHHVDPDLYYELLTKRSLALSGVPTPAAQIVDFDIDQDIDVAVARAVETVEARPLPFVLKTNTCFGGRGTFMVRAHQDRQEVIQTIRHNLQRELKKINEENKNLHPFSLVMTDMLPGDTHSINFYVKCNGQAWMSSVCEQTLSGGFNWSGAVVTYSAQPQLMARYNELVHKTAAFLHSRGYYGPVGIDVMTGKDGEDVVVDLNPRPTGSFALGCLRPHLAKVLGFDAACVLCHVEFSASRDDFSTAFQRELERGEIIIIAWFTELQESRSHASLVVSGEVNADMQELRKRIKDWIHVNER